VLNRFESRLRNQVSAAESQQIFHPGDLLFMLTDSIKFIRKSPGLKDFVPNRCLDLGSGQGYVLLAMAIFLLSFNNLDNSLVVGIEFDLNLVMTSICEIYRVNLPGFDLDQIRKTIIVLYGNIFHLPNIDFNVVYSYLITQDMSENLFYKILELCLSSNDVTLLYFSETTQVQLYSPLGLLCCLLTDQGNMDREQGEVRDIIERYKRVTDFSKVENTLYKRLLKNAGDDLLIKQYKIRTVDLRKDENFENMYVLNVKHLRRKIGPTGTNQDIAFIFKELRGDFELVSDDAKASQTENPTWATNGLSTRNLVDTNLRIDSASGRRVVDIQQAVEKWSKDRNHFIAPVLHNTVRERRSSSHRNNTNQAADSQSKRNASEALESLAQRRKKTS
jgi:hypothetical protein